MTCPLTYEQLASHAAESNKLELIGQMLVEAGLITQAELEIAKILKQGYYSPHHRRFANIQPRPVGGEADVVWFEPMKLPRPTCLGGRRKAH